MKIAEIWKLEQENSADIYLINEGLFWRAYEKSAFLFNINIKQYKVTCKFVKAIGAKVVSCGFPVDLFKAYFDARKNKRNTTNQLRFEHQYESKLINLYNEIINRTYEINTGICFINFEPVQREIFAADFRDRVVHHLIYNYISPVFDRVFINDAYSCRKGKGTSYGIHRLQHFILSCSQNYQQPAYILKLEIKGYFMAMHRQILFDKILSTLKKYQERIISEFQHLNTYFEKIIYLLAKVIFNDPTKNCIIKGKASDWNGLPPTKSLFHAKPGCGLPIGNLTPQLFGNVYMNDFDHYIKYQLKCKYYGRYVDDFVIVHNDHYFLKGLIPKISTYLQEKLQLELHPNKIYLQPAENGVQFLGATIKPHRTDLKNRTKGNFTPVSRCCMSRLTIIFSSCLGNPPLIM